MENQIMNSEQDGFKITSPSMKEVYEEIYDFARQRKSCIFHGPTGCGKEFLAKYYYRVFAKDGKKPFLSFNCAGLTQQLAVSELAGYVKGSPSQALKDKDGLILKTKGGLLFLD